MGAGKGLAAKLVEAALDVENVTKRGNNTQQKYRYAMAEDVAAAATKALLARGVIADFECIRSEAHPIKSRQGTDGLIVTARCRLVVTDSETGESHERSVIGSGSDYPGDKAIYKAMTGARKYAFIHLLDIPIGDDPEEERSEAKPKNAPKMPAAEAKKIVEAAWKIPAAKDALRLAASHVADGRDVGDCDTKAKAQKAIGSLNAHQGERLRDWIQSKANDEEAPDA